MHSAVLYYIHGFSTPQRVHKRKLDMKPTQRYPLRKLPSGKIAIEQHTINGYDITFNPDDARFYITRLVGGDDVTMATATMLRNAVQWCKIHNDITKVDMNYQAAIDHAIELSGDGCSHHVCARIVMGNDGQPRIAPNGYYVSDWNDSGTIGSGNRGHYFPLI